VETDGHHRHNWPTVQQSHLVWTAWEVYQRPSEVLAQMETIRKSDFKEG